MQSPLWQWQYCSDSCLQLHMIALFSPSHGFSYTPHHQLFYQHTALLVILSGMQLRPDWSFTRHVNCFVVNRACLQEEVWILWEEHWTSFVLLIFIANCLGEMAAPAVEQSMQYVPIIWRTNTQLQCWEHLSGTRLISWFSTVICKISPSGSCYQL